MNRGQSRVRDFVERLLDVMSLEEIAQRAGLTSAEVESAQKGQATNSAVVALDKLGDEMDREWAIQNR